MPITPDTLQPAAAALYRQYRHLEVDDPQGLTAEEAGWPVATTCAALMAPVEKLYALLALPAAPWQSAFDVEIAPGWVLPWVANFAGVELPPGLTEDEQRARLLEAPARYRGTVGAMESRARETLTGGRRAWVQERDGSPDDATVVTLSGETPDPAFVLRRVEEVTPGDVWLTYIATPGPAYVLTRAAHSTYAEVRAAHPTYMHLRDTVPA